MADAAMTDIAMTDTGGGSADTSSAGDGTCLSPRDVVVGFHTDAMASTASNLDVTKLSCHQTPTVPEAVFRLTVSQTTHVVMSGNDESGAGIGAEVRVDSCTGTSVACEWEPNGNLSRTIDLPAGTWIIAVERSPAGRYSFGLDP